MAMLDFRIPTPARDDKPKKNLARHLGHKVPRLPSAVGCNKPRQAVLYPDTVAGADPKVGTY